MADVSTFETPLKAPSPSIPLGLDHPEELLAL